MWSLRPDHECKHDAHLEKRFWRNVKNVGGIGCWPWSLSLRKETGHGEFVASGWNVPSHQYAWECENGPVPPRKLVAHVCGNKACCKPSHLELVTWSDLAIRRREKVQGSNNGRAKLMADKVYEIRELYDEGENPTDIAKLYSVSRRTIVLIGQRKNWRHLKERVELKEPESDVREYYGGVWVL